MSKLILTLASLFIITCTFAQLEIPTNPIIYDLNFSIKNGAGYGLKVAKKDTSTVLPDGILSIQTRMSDADLVLQAKVSAPGNREVQRFKLVLRDKNGVEIIPAISDYVNYNESTNKKIASNTIIWKNITEDDSFLANEYTLTYYVEKYIIIGIDCDNPPKFGAKEQLPYLGGALIGAGIMAYSRKTREDAQKAFLEAEEIAETYQVDWESGQDEDGSLGQQYEDFRSNGVTLNKRQKSQFIGGAIVLGVDILAYLTHRILYNRKKKLYKEYCTDQKTNLKVKPIIESGATSYNQRIGLGLTYTF